MNKLLLILFLALAPSVAFAAIARDANSQAFVAANTTITASHTITGTQTLLLVYLVSVTSIDDDACTYNGTSMTKLNELDFTADGTDQYVFGLINPASGTHTISCTDGTTDTKLLVGSSYTGVKQTGLPDSAPTPNSSLLAINLTQNFTTIADNSWTFIGGRAGGATGVSADSGSSLIVKVASHPQTAAFDAGPITPAGSKSMAINSSGDGNVKMATVGVSFAPFAASVSSFNFWQFFGF